VFVVFPLFQIVASCFGIGMISRDTSALTVKF
jgi:hypothetical protein